ncbi:hypothetical protein BD779DRAFT_1531477 [Infundibulicybe gibba]|nr:hypothetical protein BD779DRAFT_1531477 [Infundibulicybe gibba]
MLCSNLPYLSPASIIPILALPMGTKKAQGPGGCYCIKSHQAPKNQDGSAPPRSRWRFDSDNDGPTLPYVHESVQKKRRKSSQPKSKYVPADETSDLRDQRTIFIGNLSVEVARKRPLLKQLQRHILSLVPTAKIESTRFRSIPFQAPTSKLPASDDEDATANAKSKSTAPKQSRAHDQERVSSWRNRQPTDAAADEDAGASDAKKFLNPNQKKKIAFINHEFHSTADSVNAYVVFAHPVPDAVTETRPSNIPPPPPTLDPYAAAKIAVEKCNGTMFMERIMRVDAVGKKHSGLSLTPPKGNATATIDGDPKLSIFVGNLDFASKEEDLRVFFEGIVSAERGPPSPGEESNEDESTSGPEKPKTWVTRVRIVRDKETQLGKGFGYIQFADRECVDEILAIEEAKLKFAKRKLRVQRCKTLPGASSTATQKPLATSTSATKSRPLPTPIVIPKGDPNLGAKLAHLPKEERKQVKSADADRVARRLAKKKARGALEKKGVKVLGKERERVRKVGGKKGVGAGGSGSGKKQEGKGGKSGRGRVRSDKGLTTRKTKK